VTELNRASCADRPPYAQDLENTVGAWDMYGQEDSKRYPGIQNEFFERAASSISSRGSLLRLVTVGARLPARFQTPAGAAVRSDVGCRLAANDTC